MGFIIDNFNNQTDLYEYDFGTGAPGAFLRRSHTDYVIDTIYTDYTGAHLRRLPLQTWVSSDIAGNTKASLTQFEYDNYTGAGNSAPLVIRSNVAGHDSANYSSSYTRRGNLTKATSYGVAASQTGAVTASSQFDILGNVAKTIDARGFISTIDYTDRFGTPNDEARSNTAPSQLNGQSTFAFPTSVTNQMGWVTGYSQFDYFTGAPVNTEDLNGVISKTFYNDILDRPTQTVSAVGTLLVRQSNIIYDDANRRIESKSDLNQLNDNLLKSESFYDGLGRTFETRNYRDGGYVVTKTEFDGLGRTKRVTNPYRPLLNEPQLWTETFYDALSRIVKIRTPDNAEVNTSYSGNTVTVTDQAGKQRRSIMNGLGQLIRVDESNTSGLGSVSSPNQPTYYDYDTLSNLTTVKQGGTYSVPEQTRTFGYNSLSRLTSATNPESGSVSSTFDANGNILTQRDARGIKTIFDYDALNRVIKKCYRVIGTGSLGATNCSQAGGETVEPNTSDVTYTYDSATVSLSKGKLTKIQNGVATTEFTGFDANSNILSHKQTADGNVYSTSYIYNLSGDLLEETYPSGRVVKNVLNNGGDLTIVQSKKNSTSGFFNYASNFTYAPSGRVTSMRLGNHAWESVQLNTRLQPTQIALGTTANAVDLWKINYEFGELQGNGTVDATKNNSNIGKQLVTVPTVAQTAGFTATQTFTYDSLKRLKTATETVNSAQSWKQTFNYDQYGNRTFDAANTTTLGSCPAAVCNPTLNTTDNRISGGQGYSFDSGGNVTQNANNTKFVYDASNKIVEVRNASTNALITRNYYDGDGTRTKIEENGVTTIFVYDAFNNVVAEYASAQQATAPKVSYLTTDLLGTPRVITDENRQILSRRDMTPFGEELTVGTGGRTLGQQYNVTDGVRQKFTGQQRDETAKLDYFNARHLSFGHGRFMSADNFGGKLSNPQSLNLYAYALNNPLKWVDPTGHSPDDPKDCIKDGVAQCRNNGDNAAIKPNGDPYWLNREVVNVNGDGTPAGPSSRQAAAPPADLPFSFWDLVPVVGPLRGFAYNANCNRGGGCNMSRATGNFALLAADLSPLGAGVRGINATRNAFIREVVSETTETGASNLIRNSADDAASTLYHYTDNVSAGAIQNSQLGKSGGNLFLTPNRNLSPLQAQIELALPKGNSATAVFEVSSRAISPSNIVRSGRVTGNVFRRAGGGAEVVVRQTIPPSGFKRIR